MTNYIKELKARPSRSFYMAVAEGITWSTLGLIVALAFVYLDFKSSAFLLDSDFARRVDGTCSGWTPFLAKVHIVGEILHWYAYCSIAIVFWRLHPPMKNVPFSAITTALVGWIFIGCGVTHMFSAVTSYWPIYRASGAWLVMNGLWSLAASIFVAYSLTKAFEFVKMHRMAIDQLQEDHQRHVEYVEDSIRFDDK